jgi:hypothetical protein
LGKLKTAEGYNISLVGAGHRGGSNADAVPAGIRQQRTVRLHRTRGRPVVVVSAVGGARVLVVLDVRAEKNLAWLDYWFAEHNSPLDRPSCVEMSTERDDAFRNGSSARVAVRGRNRGRAARVFAHATTQEPCRDGTLAVAVDQSHFGTDRTIDQLSVGRSSNQCDTDNLAKWSGMNRTAIRQPLAVGMIGD